MNISKFESPTARLSHEELLEALGTENNPGQWMIFMETVDRLIPELAAQGRLSNEVLKRTFIGQLGFASWKEYVEAPTGLNWKMGGWAGYRRAWSTVKAFPYLREMDLTSSRVNQLARSLQLEDKDFPESREDLELALEQKKQQQAELRAGKQSALLEQIAELEAKLTEVQTKAMELERQNISLEAESKTAELTLSNQQLELTGQLNAQRQEFDAQIVQIRSEHNLQLGAKNDELTELRLENQRLKEPKPLSRFQALKIVVFGE